MCVLWFSAIHNYHCASFPKLIPKYVWFCFVPRFLCGAVGKVLNSTWPINAGRCLRILAGLMRLRMGMAVSCLWPASFNSLAPGWSECDSKNVIFSLVLLIGIFKLFMIMPSDECHRTLLMISRHCFRLWLGAVRHQAITWANVDSVHCRLIASLGHNELTYCGRYKTSTILPTFSSTFSGMTILNFDSRFTKYS